MDIDTKKNKKLTIYALYLLFLLPMTSAHTYCNGKSFQCRNSTHFTICFNIGNGVSIAIPNIIIPCPRGTECHNGNKFECEHVKTTTSTTSDVTNMQRLVSAEIFTQNEKHILTTTEVIPNKQEQGYLKEGIKTEDTKAMKTTTENIKLLSDTTTMISYKPSTINNQIEDSINLIETTTSIPEITIESNTENSFKKPTESTTTDFTTEITFSNNNITENNNIGVATADLNDSTKPLLEKNAIDTSIFEENTLIYDETKLRKPEVSMTTDQYTNLENITQVTYDTTIKKVIRTPTQNTVPDIIGKTTYEDFAQNSITEESVTSADLSSIIEPYTNLEITIENQATTIKESLMLIDKNTIQNMTDVKITDTTPHTDLTTHYDLSVTKDPIDISIFEEYTVIYNATKPINPVVSITTDQYTITENISPETHVVSQYTSTQSVNPTQNTRHDIIEKTTFEDLAQNSITEESVTSADLSPTIEAYTLEITIENQASTSTESLIITDKNIIQNMTDVKITDTTPHTDLTTHYDLSVTKGLIDTSIFEEYTLMYDETKLTNSVVSITTDQYTNPENISPETHDTTIKMATINPSQNTGQNKIEPTTFEDFTSNHVNEETVISPDLNSITERYTNSEVLLDNKATTIKDSIKTTDKKAIQAIRSLTTPYDSYITIDPLDTSIFEEHTPTYNEINLKKPDVSITTNQYINPENILLQTHDTEQDKIMSRFEDFTSNHISKESVISLDLSSTTEPYTNTEIPVYTKAITMKESIITTNKNIIQNIATDKVKSDTTPYNDFKPAYDLSVITDDIATPKAASINIYNTGVYDSTKVSEESTTKKIEYEVNTQEITENTLMYEDTNDMEYITKHFKYNNPSSTTGKIKTTTLLNNEYFKKAPMNEDKTTITNSIYTVRPENIPSTMSLEKETTAHNLVSDNFFDNTVTEEVTTFLPVYLPFIENNEQLEIATESTSNINDLILTKTSIPSLPDELFIVKITSPYNYYTDNIDNLSKETTVFDKTTIVSTEKSTTYLDKPFESHFSTEPTSDMEKTNADNIISTETSLLRTSSAISDVETTSTMTEIKTTPYFSIQSTTNMELPKVKQDITTTKYMMPFKPFSCLSEGRFSDNLQNNIYYICVKGKDNKLYKFKFQCQVGYILDKNIVKCFKDLSKELHSTTDLYYTTSITESKYNLDQRNPSIIEKEIVTIRSFNSNNPQVTFSSKKSLEIDTATNAYNLLETSPTTEVTIKSHTQQLPTFEYTKRTTYLENAKQETPTDLGNIATTKYMFVCIKEGRFLDNLNENVYYICVKGKDNILYKFKFQCQNDYLLDKISIKCMKDIKEETSSTVTTNILVPVTNYSTTVKMTTEQYKDNLDGNITTRDSTTKPITDTFILDTTIDIYNFTTTLSTIYLGSDTIKSLNSERPQNTEKSSEFHCSKEGRFIDYFENNIYYICVKGKDNKLYRFKFQCQIGYYLNKNNVKCMKNEISTTTELATTLRSTIIAVKSYLTTEQYSNINNKQTEMLDENEDNIKFNEDNKPGFDCSNKDRGTYSDTNDCNRFYSCVNGDVTTHYCPNNTVFSEVKKQCTSNLSYCVRNNTFQCVREGRFYEYRKDNIYYICVKANSGKLYKFQFQCSLGYVLDKDNVKCIIKNENKVTELDKVSQSIESSIEKSEDKTSNEKEWECNEEGYFPNPQDCTTYYSCVWNLTVFKRLSFACKQGEVFHRERKKCVVSQSYECDD